jgi:hypothetical protein
MLTIAIPTYNRNDLLAAAVARLIPQMKDTHRLLIIDNCSDIPALNFISELVEGRIADRIKIIRNIVNIGGGANILRCLELCETEWMYCLGDDDLVAEDCLKKIDMAIQKNRDCHYISFSRKEFKRGQTKISSGLKEFVGALDDWPTFLFMSSSVVNCSALKPYIKNSYINLYSWAPLQVALLSSLQENGRVLFSADIICEEISMSPSTWNPLVIAEGKMILPNMIQEPLIRVLFAKKLAARPGLTFLAYHASVSDDEGDLNRRLFGSLVTRCREHKIGFMKTIYARFLVLLLHLPRFLRQPIFNSVPWLYGLTGKTMVRSKVDADRL